MSLSGDKIGDDQLLIRYLLGSLEEDKAERLDELSVADDDFAWRLKAVENDMVDSYVRGDLSGETLARFESFYVSTPRRRERVEFARALLAFTAKHAPPRTRGWFTAPLVIPRVGIRLRRRGSGRRRRVADLQSTAASNTGEPGSGLSQRSATARAGIAERTRSGVAGNPAAANRTTGCPTHDACCLADSSHAKCGPCADRETIPGHGPRRY